MVSIYIHKATREQTALLKNKKRLYHIEQQSFQSFEEGLNI